MRLWLDSKEKRRSAHVEWKFLSPFLLSLFPLDINEWVVVAIASLILISLFLYFSLFFFFLKLCYELKTTMVDWTVTTIIETIISGPNKGGME